MTSTVKSKKIDEVPGLNNCRGLTLIETIITAGILAVVVVGLLQLFAYCSQLSEMSGNLTLAISAAQDKIEEIRRHDFDTIVVDYASGGTPGNTFDLSQITGKGSVYIDSSNPELLEIEVDVSWLNNRDDRLIGEDLDLDGVVDSGEDVNSNGKLDSPAKVVTYVARR